MIDDLDEDTLLDIEDPDLSHKLSFALKAVQGSTAYRNDRERPYNGQPWTDNGVRGQTEVKGLTMRDISDCIVQGFLSASGNGDLQHKCFAKDDEERPWMKGDWRHDDIYHVDSDVDPGAVIQNALCYVESYMGIFPNVKRGGPDDH